MSNINWERRYEALKAIHDELAEDSLSVFDADINFDETTRLVRYKGELYTIIAPLGQIWKYDKKDWKKAYDIGEEVGRNPVDPSNVYSKWAFSCWAIKHCSFDDKLYFGGMWYPGNGAAIVRYAKSTEKWEFLDLSSEIGGSEILVLEEFGNYLYAATNAGDIWRSTDGQNWTKVFDGVTGYNLIHALSADELHGGNKIRAGLSTWEKGNMVSSGDGKVYVSSDGVSWAEELDLPDTGGVVSLATYGTNRVLCGTNMGYVYLWDGGYQQWRKIGNVGLPVMEIKWRNGLYSDYEALLVCGTRSGVGSGSIWRLCNARLIQLGRVHSHAISSIESYGAHLYYSWNWSEIPSKTYIRGVFAGVKRVRELSLRQNTEPFLEPISVTTGDSWSSILRFNLGVWKNRILWLRNSAANSFLYELYGSLDGRTYYSLGQNTGPAQGNSIEIDLSESVYAVIDLKVKSAVGGQSTTVNAAISCW